MAEDNQSNELPPSAPAPTENISKINVAEEIKNSFLDYSMSVIISRALPDVRDGLKPSQRRILYAMNDLGVQPNRKHVKCAKIVGETMGNYHSNGDRQSNSRLGTTLVLPVGRRNSIKVAVSRGAVIRYGADFTTFSIAWQTGWISSPKPTTHSGGVSPRGQ